MVPKASIQALTPHHLEPAQLQRRIRAWGSLQPGCSVFPLQHRSPAPWGSAPDRSARHAPTPPPQTLRWFLRGDLFKFGFMVRMPTAAPTSPAPCAARLAGAHNLPNLEGGSSPSPVLLDV